MSGARRRLLVVDDDQLLCEAVRAHLGSDDLEVLVAHDAARALATCAASAVDVVVLDQHLPDGSGDALCGRILELHPSAKIVFVTAYPSFEHAVAALKAGAHDYLCKPFELEELRLAVRRWLDTLDLERVEHLAAWRSAQERQEAVLVGGEALAPLREIVTLAAGSEAPVLVTGETGTGKNVVAKAIHFGGPRRARPLVSINCAALPENLVEAELFGWERGAFTGAVATREGLMEMAHGGTLFLDEIGEMPLLLQTKLLPVLEEAQVKRLGGRTVRDVDVRIVAATNADLEARVGDGRFRKDLFYRLDVIRAHLPPLRERPDDLPLLCEHLLSRLSRRDPAPGLAPGELEALRAYPWPGNVRELRNVLERALVLQREPLRPSELLLPGGAAPVREAVAAGEPGTEADEAELTLAALERRHVERVLHRHGGNLSRSARALGISLSTLKRRVREFGLRGVKLDQAPSSLAHPS